MLQFMPKTALFQEFYGFQSSIQVFTAPEFIFVYGVRKYSNFILFHVAVQYSQHHLLKRLSFLHCIFFPPLSKIRFKRTGVLCILMADSCCCVAETNTTLQSNYPPTTNKLKKLIVIALQCCVGFCPQAHWLPSLSASI